ncbi:uncharacterized protein LOC122502169 [Leptopilina heterotoma]|uniref:uncharacterized protein LOC122502169 n=1 Tax=Leptopilina heterotoma TaxID=63436 RepID=UPI001CA8DC23|nr:uncharacterized protein LOC122502169 [Leptopilina heterotoma]
MIRTYFISCCNFLISVIYIQFVDLISMDSSEQVIKNISSNEQSESDSKAFRKRNADLIDFKNNGDSIVGEQKMPKTNKDSSKSRQYIYTDSEDSETSVSRNYVKGLFNTNNIIATEQNNEYSQNYKERKTSINKLHNSTDELESMSMSRVEQNLFITEQYAIEPKSGSSKPSKTQEIMIGRTEIPKQPKLVPSNEFYGKLKFNCIYKFNRVSSEQGNREFSTTVKN